jgi:hypothetical protein
MPPHSAIAEIMLKFRVQLHQLTPNVIVQLFKFFWVVGTYGGTPTSEDFSKRYELHYQTKKVQVGDKVLSTQFGYFNFHSKHYKDSEVKLTLVVKNKWSMGWTRAWFNCKVPFTEAHMVGKYPCFALSHEPIGLLDGAYS